jgi:hypothetical protein
MALRCRKYKFAEEGWPCLAATATSGTMWVVLGTLIGRQIDRAVGNERVYRRPPR